MADLSGKVKPKAELGAKVIRRERLDFPRKSLSSRIFMKVKTLLRS
jgi:hypothetical protein